jgi:hypothetical protein
MVTPWIFKETKIFISNAFSEPRIGICRVCWKNSSIIKVKINNFQRTKSSAKSTQVWTKLLTKERRDFLFTSLLIKFMDQCFRIRIRDPVLFYPLDTGSGAFYLRDPEPGFGAVLPLGIRIRDEFFPDLGSFGLRLRLCS